MEGLLSALAVYMKQIEIRQDEEMDWQFFDDHCFSDIPSIEAQPCSSSHPNMKVTLMKQFPQSTKISGKENVG